MLIKLIEIFFLFFAVAAIIPYLWPNRMSEKQKRMLNQVKFYGSENGPDRVCVIENPADALNIRLRLVQSASKTLDITCYDVTRDNCADAFLGEVINAANRNVRVRFIMDGKVCSRKMFRTLKAMTTHANISCRVYNPFRLLQPWKLQTLMHDKFMIADNQYLLLGGRNIGNRYFNPVDYQKPVAYDRDVFVTKTKSSSETASSVSQAVCYMDELFLSADASPVPDMKNHQKAKQLFRYLMESTRLFKRTNPQFYRKSFQFYKQQTVPTSRITLIHNPIHTQKKKPWIAYQLLRLASNAKKEVVLQTPYVTGNKRLLDGMRKFANRIKFTMLTNSMTSSPNFPAFSNYYCHRKKFLRIGTKIFEYQSKDSIHGKSILFDNRISAVGSFNMDSRSMYIDTECMLIIDSPELAAQLGGALNRVREKSLMVGYDNRYATAGQPGAVKAPKIKTSAMELLYCLLRPFQFLL